MIDSESATGRLSAESMFAANRERPFPTLDRTLAIAQTGTRDPSSLTPQDIQDLSRVMLMHYARMGLA